VPWCVVGVLTHIDAPHRTWRYHRLEIGW
jgi:hypothetical protein